MKNNATAVYPTVIGNMLVRETDGYISEISLVQERKKYESVPSDLTDIAIKQIREYLAGERKDFDIPVSADGTEFQREVWAAISDITYGNTATYTDLAKRIGKPCAVRAAANACGANPIMIVVPCHRVVGKNNIGGYEFGTAVKEKLIELEKQN